MYFIYDFLYKKKNYKIVLVKILFIIIKKFHKILCKNKIYKLKFISI